MPMLTIKPTHRPVEEHYTALQEFARLGATHEVVLRSAFQALLEQCARLVRWTLLFEQTVNPRGNTRFQMAR